jgi:hypothetical protein
MTTPHYGTVADCSCQVHPHKDRGPRISLAITPTHAAPLDFELAPLMAERLAYQLHYLCRCAAVNPTASGGDLAYPADKCRLRFDPLTGSGELSFSSRGSHAIHVRLSLDALFDLRTALAAVK